MSEKIPVITMPNYVVYLEHFYGKIWVHTDVYKWSARIKEEYKEYLDFKLDSLRQTVYAVNEEEGNEKRKKFMELMGFKFHSRNNFGNGEIRDVYRRDCNYGIVSKRD